MKSSRRSRLASNGTSKRSKSTPMSPPKSRPQPQSDQSPTHPPPPQPAQCTTTTTTTTTTATTTACATSLTAADRYQKNLNSLRRIDPTIVSIIDKFSHVCLYRLHEGKWQKDGFEGASFLFERAAYPPYGVFILNRAGMYDYIHPIYPEDEIEAKGEYLMYRSYPKFTAKRLAMAESAPKLLTESWTDAHHRPPSVDDPLTNWSYLLNRKLEKGPDEIVMFWFLGSDSEQHEPLSDTIERLMSFIRKGEPYPYNLDRPPPRIQRPPSTDVGSQESSATSAVEASFAPLPQQSSQPPTTATNGTVSDLDKLFSKLLPSASPAPNSNNGNVTMDTLFASASPSASSTPTATLVNTPPASTNKGLALLDTIFASATPPPAGFSAPTPPPLHHVSSVPFPPPPSAPPSTRLAFAQAHQHSDISSSEPESSEPASPTYPAAAAQLIHSPQPTTSQLPQILNQDVISALLGMPPSRTSSVASSQRRYEGDVESSDDPHEADSPIEQRPQPHANRARRHDLGDVTPRPPLRVFASSEKVLPTPPAPTLPSHHSAPSALPTAAASVPPCVPAATPSEPAPIVVTAAPAPAPVSAPVPAPTVPTPRTGTSPAPRALVPFHADSSLWPYPRVPLDDRDDIVELDFADTSALSDVDAFERRRLNGRKGAKHSKKDKARERDEIERSWDVPGKSITPNLDAGPSYAPAILGRPSPQPQAQLAAGSARGSAAASPAPHSQSGVGTSSVKPSQPNNLNSAPALVKNPEPSSSNGGPSTAPPSSNNKSKSKAKSVPNGPNGKASTPATTQAQANGAATLVKSAASAAIIEAVHAPPNGNSNGNGSLPPTDRNEFVREVLALIHTDSSFVDRLWTEYRARA